MTVINFSQDGERSILIAQTSDDARHVKERRNVVNNTILTKYLGYLHSLPTYFLVCVCFFFKHSFTQCFSFEIGFFRFGNLACVMFAAPVLRVYYVSKTSHQKLYIIIIISVFLNHPLV